MSMAPETNQRLYVIKYFTPAAGPAGHTFLAVSSVAPTEREVRTFVERRVNREIDWLLPPRLETRVFFPPYTRNRVGLESFGEYIEVHDKGPFERT
ncbi:hypothetical protein HYV81_05745 [Candidatus Woesearchaeota archaeon]|nr:hypothetical protein [Candidatus Woesearchaeota archaeon]